MPMKFSVEFFPPKDDLGEARLWQAISDLDEISLNFISVTYGAGGGTRERTIRIAKEIQNKTSAPTVAHLTCVGSTKNELIEILNQYKSTGIKSILALRGDPTSGPRGEWIATPGGFTHSDELVSLIKDLGGFEIGVAAFPDGHPESNGNFQRDLQVLLRKEELGATFATTQFFFDVNNLFRLADELKKLGSKLKLIPGILPITNVKQLERMVELNGSIIPKNVSQLFSGDLTPEEVREIGIDISTNMVEAIIKAGFEELHFYTMNSAYSTTQIIKRIKG